MPPSITYHIVNPHDRPIRLPNGIDLPPHGRSEQTFTSAALRRVMPYIVRYALTLMPGVDGPAFRPAPKNDPILEDIVREIAETELSIAHIERIRKFEPPPPARSPERENTVEILPDRLIMTFSDTSPALECATVIVNLTGAPIPTTSRKTLQISWLLPDVVKVRLLAPAVHLVTAMLREPDAKVLILGPEIEAELLTGFVIRSHFGVDSLKAVRILKRRKGRPLARKGLARLLGRWKNQ